MTLRLRLDIAANWTPVILVTKDILLCLKARLIGIEAEDFTTEQSPVPAEQYTGRAEVYTADEKMADMKKKGLLPQEVYLISDCKILNALRCNGWGTFFRI